MKEQLTSLQALLDGALATVAELEADPHFARLVTVFSQMPGEDREVILAVLEREVGLRVIAKTSPPPLSGMSVARPNPHARLYSRVVDPEEPEPYVSQEELMYAVLRAARTASALLTRTHDDEERWMETIAAALHQLEPTERRTIARLVGRMVEVLTRVELEVTSAGPPPPAAATPARSS